jgi:hypothetical protein
VALGLSLLVVRKNSDHRSLDAGICVTWGEVRAGNHYVKQRLPTSSERQEEPASQVGGRVSLALSSSCLQDPQQLDHPTDQQPLIIHLHPGAGFRGEDDVVAGLDRHLNPG